MLQEPEDCAGSHVLAPKSSRQNPGTHSGSSAAQAAIRIGSAAISGGWKAGPGHPWAIQGLKPSKPLEGGGCRDHPASQRPAPEPHLSGPCPPGPHLPALHPSSCLFRRLTSQLQSQKLLVSELQRPEPRGSEGHLGQGSRQSWTRLRSLDPGPVLAPVTLPLGATRAGLLSRHATPRGLLAQAPPPEPSWSRLHPQRPLNS